MRKYSPKNGLIGNYILMLTWLDRFRWIGHRSPVWVWPNKLHSCHVCSVSRWDPTMSGQCDCTGFSFVEGITVIDRQAGKHSLHTHLTAAGLRHALAPLRREHVLLLGHVLQPRPLHNRRSGVSHHPCGRFVWRIITLYCGNYLLCRLHCSPLCSSIFVEVTNSVRI